MTVSLFAPGTHVASVQRDPRGAGPPAGGPAHAVARPTVDGLEVSVCGVLVDALAGTDWLEVDDTGRCPECARIAG
jgi:hypothetical protein